jgi:hypothetical protein
MGSASYFFGPLSGDCAVENSPVRSVADGTPSTSFNQGGDLDHFNHDTDRHRDEPGDFFFLFSGP